MKLAIRFLLVFVISFLLSNNKANATHIYGGELLYTYLSGDSYEITLTLYGDCSGSSYPLIVEAMPGIEIYDGNTLYQSVLLQEDSLLRKEVSPVCARDSNKTSCRSTDINALPGVTRFVFKRTVSLPTKSNWRIVFAGAMNDPGSSRAGRSTSITNVVLGGNGLPIYLIATLNNSQSHNSSPIYTTIPTPFYCINRPQEYNQGAIDNDGDSLSFSTIPGITDGSPLTYISPYSGSAPLAAQQGTYKFNTVSGQLSFLPNMVQRSLVVTKVEEYKDGMLVGSSMREMTFIVLNNCNNSPPIGTIDTNSVEGGGAIDNEIRVCLSTPNLSLKIPASDSDFNNITIDIKSIPPGAIAKVVANNTPGATILLDWATGNVPLGSYNMFVTYTDDACPLKSSQTIGYTIRIVKPIGISHEVIQPTGCLFRQHVAIKLTDGAIPRHVDITNKSGQLLYSYTDTTGVIIDSFTKGTYKVYAESPALRCKTEYEFTVVDSGTLPVKPLWNNLDVCLNDPPGTLYAKPMQGSYIKWYDAEKATLSIAPTYNTDVIGKQVWYVTQFLDTCESALDTFSVTVHELPNINILNTPQRLCAGDSIHLMAEGGVKYEWHPQQHIFKNDTITYTRVRGESVYSVRGYDEYNCANTDTTVFDDIDKCCVFSYPDAFTPNGDGLNDGWKPICYGNTEAYLLTIYNRWGERVFITHHEDERWDGTYKGVPCEIGSYSYYLIARCVSSRQETAKGSFILIR